MIVPRSVLVATISAALAVAGTAAAAPASGQAGATPVGWQRVPDPPLAGSSAWLDGVAAGGAGAAWFAYTSPDLRDSFSGAAGYRTGSGWLVDQLAGGGSATRAEATAIARAAGHTIVVGNFLDGTDETNDHSYLGISTTTGFRVIRSQPGQFQAVAGTSTDDIWVGTPYGTRHFDGTHLVATGPTGGVVGIAAISATNVWAVGDAVWHWNGLRWSRTPAPAIVGTPTAVSATGPNNVWLAGTRGVARFAGGRWHATAAPSLAYGSVSATWYGVWFTASSSSGAVIVGLLNGRWTTTKVAAPVLGYGLTLRGISAWRGEVWVAGYYSVGTGDDQARMPYAIRH